MTRQVHIPIVTPPADYEAHPGLGSTVLKLDEMLDKKDRVDA
jgi:hypothetical protein